jgi:hypothetical protein
LGAKNFYQQDVSDEHGFGVRLANEFSTTLTPDISLMDAPIQELLRRREWQTTNFRKRISL